MAKERGERGGAGDWRKVETLKKFTIRTMVEPKAEWLM